MRETNKQVLINVIQYPIITDKATKLIEENQYSFAVEGKANKMDIKQAIEYIFDVKVKKVNTCWHPPKMKRVGKFIGKKSNYKKAIVTLNKNYKINIFPDS